MRRARSTTIVVLSGCWLVGCMVGHEIEQGQEGLRKAQMRLLAARILENTPEFIHFDQGTVFQWVFLDPDTKAQPELREEVVQRLGRKYTVYLDEKDIPDALVEKTADGAGCVAYRAGFFFSFKVEPQDDGTVKVQYRDWEGVRAATSHWTTYKWTGSEWTAIEEGPMTIS